MISLGRRRAPAPGRVETGRSRIGGSSTFRPPTLLNGLDPFDQLSELGAVLVPHRFWLKHEHFEANCDRRENRQGTQGRVDQQNGSSASGRRGGRELNEAASIGSGRAPDLQADFSELVDQSAIMYYGPGAFALATMEIRALGWDLFCLRNRAKPRRLMP